VFELRFAPSGSRSTPGKGAREELVGKRDFGILSLKLGRCDTQAHIRVYKQMMKSPLIGLIREEVEYDL
jgi:hypothetical protein